MSEVYKTDRWVKFLKEFNSRIWDSLSYTQCSNTPHDVGVYFVGHRGHRIM